MIESFLVWLFGPQLWEMAAGFALFVAIIALIALLIAAVERFTKT